MSRLSDHQLASLKDGLVRTLDDWAPKRFPGLRRDGELYRMGDLDGGPGQSCVINRRGARAGSFHDFAAHSHGGVLDLWMAATRLADFRAACEEAARYLADPAILAALERAPSPAQRARDDADEFARKTRAAKRLFLEAQPLAGSPAEAYLLGRGLVVSALPRPPGALRFHAGLRCPETFRETGELRPALVAMVSGRDGGQTALHRTFLARLPDGRVVKAPDMRNAKRSLGPVGGGFIPLARGASNRRWPDMPAGEVVYVTEGIEDGLSVALALPSARVVVAISMDNMANLPVPPSGGGYALCAQNDRPETLEKFEGVRGKLAARCPVVVARPPAGVKDWNDWAQLLGRGAPPAEACA